MNVLEVVLAPLFLLRVQDPIGAWDDWMGR